MAVNGAPVYPNQSPRYYQMRMNFHSTITISGAATSGGGDAAIMTWTWGNEYFDAGPGMAGNPSNHGIKLTISHIKLSAIDMGVTYVVLRIPYLDYTQRNTFLGWINVDALLDFVGLYENVDDQCGDWAIAWDTLEYSLNGVTYDWINSYSQSGAMYDAKLNIYKMSDGGGPSLLVEPSSPPCTEDEFDVLVSGSIILGGWRWSADGVTWIQPAIDIDPYAVPAEPGCGCIFGLTWPSSVVPDCWNVLVPFSGRLRVFDAADGTTHCICISTGLGYDLDRILKSLESTGLQNEITVAPTDAGLLGTYRESKARCYNETTGFIPDWDINSSTTTEAHTKAPYLTQGSEMLGTQECISGILPHCPIEVGGEGEGHGFSCDSLEAHWCVYQAVSKLVWTGDPCSTCNFLGLDIQTSDIIAVPCEDGGTLHVKTARKYLPLLFGEQNMGVPVTWAYPRWNDFDQKSHLIIALGNGGAGILADSKDEGDTYTSVLSFGTNVIIGTHEITHARRNFIYWLESGSGTVYGKELLSDFSSFATPSISITDANHTVSGSKGVVLQAREFVSNDGDWLINLLYIKNNGDLRLMESDRKGGTFTSYSVNIVDTYVLMASFEVNKDGRRFVYYMRHDLAHDTVGGDSVIRCKVYDKNDTCIDTFDTNIEDADYQHPMRVCEVVTNEGKWRMVLGYVDLSGNSHVLTSDNRGQNFN